MSKKRIVILGGGDRGAVYARGLARWADRVDIVGLAEPRDAYRRPLAAELGLDEGQTFADWEEAVRRVPAADAVVIAMPDRLHASSAIACAQRNWHILLEKPLATSADDCRRIAAAVREHGVMLAVCHVLRYAPYTRRIKQLLADGAIGEVVSVQHLEPVGYWHQAHSFVRGNWRNEQHSCFMLLAKCSHDVDWLSHVVNSSPRRVSSFGGLRHFRSENAPAGAGERCIACAVEADCPYSARRIYQRLYDEGCRGWPLTVLAPEVTEANLDDALRRGPHGRCVYHCDNDVVDHQVVNIEFAGGQTASMTMTAFTRPAQDRHTRIFGTRGELRCDGRRIEVYDFLTESVQTHDVDGGANHAGGDDALIDAFARALTEDDPSALLTGLDESLASHLAVFAAEDARLTGRVVEVEREA